MAQIPASLMPNDAYQQTQAVGNAIVPDFAQPMQQAEPVPQPQQEFVQPEPVQQMPVMQVPTEMVEKQIQANNAIAKAQADKAALEQSVFQQEQIKLANQAKKTQEMQAAFNTDWNTKTTELQGMANQLKDLSNAKIDNQNFWANKGTGDKVLGAIAIALGGIGGAFTGKGGNVAMDLINKAIDQDIETQKFNLNAKTQNLQSQIGLQQNMLSQLRAKFGDDLAAEAALRLIANEATANKLKAIAAGTDSQVVQKNAEIVEAKLRQEMAQQQQILKSRMMLSQMGGTGGQLSAMQLRSMGLPEEDIKAALADQERSVPGFQGMAKDKESASAFQKIVGDSVPAINAVNEILRLTKEGKNIMPEERAKVATSIKIAMGKLRVPLQGPGAMTDKDIKMLEETLGNPDSLISYTPAQRAKLTTVLKRLEQDLNTQAEAFGFRKQPEVKYNSKQPLK